jgi:hypothetical protein
MAKLTFTGRIEHISEKENGNSNGKDWTKFYIIVADGEQYENKIKVECFNKTQDFQTGQLVECELTARVNKPKDVHYFSLGLWSAKVLSTAPIQNTNESPF